MKLHLQIYNLIFKTVNLIYHQAQIEIKYYKNNHKIFSLKILAHLIQFKEKLPINKRFYILTKVKLITLKSYNKNLKLRRIILIILILIKQLKEKLMYLLMEIIVLIMDLLQKLLCIKEEIYR